MEPTHILRRLTEFVAREFLDGDGASLTPATPLLEWGVLDSMSMLALLSFIEEELGIQVPDEQVRPEHFQNLERLSALLHCLGPAAARKPAGNQASVTPSIVSRASNAPHGVQEVPITVAPGDTRSVRMAKGDGVPWVLVPDPFNPSVSWGSILRTQVGCTTTWAPSLIGLGPDDEGADAPGLAAQIDALEALVRVLPNGPFVLVGQGLGGAIAAHVAKRCPERVSALAVVSFGVVRDPTSWWQSLVERTHQSGDYLARALRDEPLASSTVLARMEQHLASRVVRHFIHEGTAALVTDAFRGLALPTLFVAGDTDRLIPPGAVEVAALQVPGSQVRWLEACGHLAHVERSAEVVEAVRGFLSEPHLTLTSA